MSCSIPAIAAALVVQKQGWIDPLSKYHGFGSENTLLLYSGKQCLSRYVLPSFQDHGGVSHKVKPQEAPTAFQDVKVVGLADVEGRINVIVNNGQVLRCTFRRYPSSLLANDCITATVEGLEVNLYNHFVGLLWGNDDSAMAEGLVALVLTVAQKFLKDGDKVEGVKHIGPAKMVFYFTGETNILYTFGGHAVTVVC
ncbi:unnamed protein product [Lactuca saligna]|uniref:Anaphase-promoting complex subunit 1 N-terminal domain-containing protein n=1 Tax=Lactuca saligna TaxID=75948 RepID=A0AA35YLX9_LACSI|nr:unnamed protein product [Lactuca saligna]